MKSCTAAVAAASLVISCNDSPKEKTPVYLDETQDIEARVEDALSRMTLDEKVAVLHAQSKFSSPGVPRLGIPEIWCTDGPHGVRPEVLYDKWKQAGWTNDSCTAYPALTALAATWNTEMSGLYGKSIGEEARYRRKNVLLGPGVNIYRTPYNGRNFEYMGEDPYLSAEMVVPYVKGVQSNNVAACVKHFCLNNQELHRHTTNVIVDDRALYEIYLPAYKAAVQKGHAWSIMGAYNLYKNQHLCENQYILDDILRGEWGFDGAVISDWGGVHDSDAVIAHGVDMEYGSWTNGLSTGRSNAYDSYFMADPYKERLRDGRASEAELDAKVRRVLRLNFRTNSGTNKGRFTCPEHYDAARKIGAESIVLLKNDAGILPLKTTASKILVVGENAIKMMTVGGGSSSLKVKKEVSPLDGIKARFAESEVVYQRGYVGDTTGEYDGVTTGQDLSESRTAEQLIADAVADAQTADYVIYIGGLNKKGHQDCEDTDREAYELPYGQDAVIEALAAVAADKLVVINITGNAYSMPWKDSVHAIMQDWYLGSEAGNSLADVLSGDVNPSGKLPFTFPVSYELCPIKTAEQYPGVKEDGIYQETYSESIYVGYRWYDTYDVETLYPFGYGLSYTSFEYGEAKVSKSTMTSGGKIKVSVDITNTGDVAGAEIVQLYISDLESSLPRPVKELKGFRKVFLQPGETAKVSFDIEKEHLSYFDDAKHEWVAEPGTFTAHVAASAEDVKSSVNFELK